MELIAPIVTGVGVLSFAVIFTILYRGYALSAIAEYESGQMDIELIDETIINNIKDSKASRKVFRTIKKAVNIAFIALLVPFLAFAVYSKLINGVAMIGGQGVIAVASGSMSVKNEANPYLANIDNQFNTYDIITLEKVESTSELGLYDVIAYVNNEGVNVIHRIVGFQPTVDGMRYVTRGDSNNMDDSYKPSIDDVLGKYTGTRVPYVGVFIMFLQSISGILTIAAVIYCLIMIESFGNKMYIAREERLIILQDAIDLQTETIKDEEMDAKFTEKVYFKEYVYTFDEKGFVSKELISEQPDAQDLNSVPDDSAENDSAAGDGNGEKI